MDTRMPGRHTNLKACRQCGEALAATFVEPVTSKLSIYRVKCPCCGMRTVGRFKRSAATRIWNSRPRTGRKTEKGGK